jgi:hypothetical protein
MYLTIALSIAAICLIAITAAITISTHTEPKNTNEDIFSMFIAGVLVSLGYGFGWPVTLPGTFIIASGVGIGVLIIKRIKKNEKSTTE